jgi:hypothetical protein
LDARIECIGKYTLDCLAHQDFIAYNFHREKNVKREIKSFTCRIPFAIARSSSRSCEGWQLSLAVCNAPGTLDTVEPHCAAGRVRWAGTGAVRDPESPQNGPSSGAHFVERLPGTRRTTTRQARSAIDIER